MPDNKSKPRKIFREPPKSTESENAQADKFREAARELETEQSEEAFDRIVKKVAKKPPKTDKPEKADK